MSDIVERLRGTAEAFELAGAPGHLALYMRAGADEITRLRAGGCARDQGTTQYCAEAVRLTAEIERLRAALGACACNCSSDCEWESGEVCPSWVARAALTAQPAEGEK